MTSASCGRPAAKTAERQRQLAGLRDQPFDRGIQSGAPARRCQLCQAASRCRPGQAEPGRRIQGRPVGDRAGLRSAWFGARQASRRNRAGNRRTRRRQAVSAASWGGCPPAGGEPGISRPGGDADDGRRARCRRLGSSTATQPMMKRRRGDVRTRVGVKPGSKMPESSFKATGGYRRLPMPAGRGFIAAARARCSPGEQGVEDVVAGVGSGGAARPRWCRRACPSIRQQALGGLFADAGNLISRPASWRATAAATDRPPRGRKAPTGRCGRRP